MADTIGVTELAEAIPTIVAAESLGYLRANTVLAQLVNRDWDNEVANYGQTVNITSRGSLSVNDKSEGTAVTLQTPTHTKTAVTLNKHKEVSFLVEDIGAALSRPEVLNAYVSDALAVLAEQIDGDLAALYSGLSQSIDATSGLGEDDFRSARRLLNAAKAPLGQRYAVLHEDAEYELLAIERFVNRDYAELQGAPQGLINAYTGRFVGFDVFVDQKITTAASECKNLMMHRDALVLATRPLPPAPRNAGVLQSVMSEGGMGLRVTVSYNPDYLGVQVTIDVLYGVAELRDNHGITVRTTEI